MTNPSQPQTRANTMTAEHTKTPWHVDAGDTDDETLIRAWPEDEGFDICSFNVDETGNIKANAARIVHCVNNFDELVEALIEVEQMIHAGEMNEGTMEVVRLAISRARGDA